MYTENSMLSRIDHYVCFGYNQVHKTVCLVLCYKINMKSSLAQMPSVEFFSTICFSRERFAWKYTGTIYLL